MGITDHDHDIPHPGVSNDSEPGFFANRVKALEKALITKGICTSAEIARAVQETESRSPADGARVVARAWNDQSYKGRLLKNGKSAVAELGYDVTDDMPELVVVENTDKIRYLVVCTLCSCYPRWLLGRPPDWYKSLSYRSRAVSEPRSVMAEFGLNVGPETAVEVLDSTADIRYLVIPNRPSNTQGFSEIQLASLVTRDSMIGASDALSCDSYDAITT